jgi:hypothetical protein
MMTYATGWEKPDTVVQHVMFANPQGRGRNSDTPVQLVAASFPNLRSLSLRDTRIFYSDLSYLSACTQLCRLELIHTGKSPSAPDTPSPLTGLRSLTDLTIISSAATAWLVAGATQLLRLRLDFKNCYTSAALFMFLQDLTQLRSLELSDVKYDRTEEHSCAFQVVQRVTATFRQLTSLTLHCLIEQRSFDLLLSSATQLTSLTCSHVHLREGRSQHSCRWKELKLTDQYFAVGPLADLPLHSLLCLTFKDAQLPTPAPQLSCFLLRGADPQPRANTLRAALFNLAGCPAWRTSGPMVQVSLRGKWQTTWSAGDLQHVLAATSPAAFKVCLCT